MAAGAENTDTTVRENICFLCKEPCLPRDKIKVFGRSSLEISALIARATKVDLSVYLASDREKAIICNSKCYKRLVKYQNAVRKLDAIVGEIQRDFHGRGLAREKRQASEQKRPLDANKRIKLEDILTSSSSSPRQTSHQALSTSQIGEKSNVCTQTTVHVVYAASNSINTASNPGISVSTFARPPILAAGNTTTKPGISVSTFARPPIFATTTKPGISVTKLDRPPILAAADSVNTTTKPGISFATFTRPPIFAATTKPGTSVTALDRPPILAAADSVNTTTKPGISFATFTRPPIFAATTKPGISVTALDRPPIFAAASSVNISKTPGTSVTTLDRPPISATAESVNTASKPVTTFARPSSIFANTTTRSGISDTTFTSPSPIFVTNIPGYQGNVSGLFQTPLSSVSVGQVFATVPFQTQKPVEKQGIRICICIDYPSKPVRKELKSDLHVLAKAMVEGSHQRIAGAVLKIDGVKKIVIEKVIKLMTLQVNDLCSTHRPSMLRATSRNTNDEANNFDYKKVCSEWQERAPIFHAFLTACAAIKNSKKKNSPECLPGVAVAGTVLLKQRNTQMNAGFAKILGFLIRSKSLEVRSYFLLLSFFFS